MIPYDPFWDPCYGCPFFSDRYGCTLAPDEPCVYDDDYDDYYDYDDGWDW